jgi:PLD-like domain
MTSLAATTSAVSLRAHVGDVKTLLAFDLMDRSDVANLAGFTIQVKPPGMQEYFLYNALQFRVPGDHAQDPTEPPYSSINAPIHKFRWLHVPGLAHQGLTPITGTYRYTVAARFFDGHGSLLPMDPAWSVSVGVDVLPFQKDGLSLGFTRGFTQSQAFVRRFGPQALIRPDDDTLLFDTTQVAGADAFGKQYTFEDEYVWSGFTARMRILEVLDEVLADPSLRVDVLAYDLNEPGVVERLLALAGHGRIRMVLDSSSLHHSTSDPKPEDEFASRFSQAAAQQGAEIIRGRFGRYAHDKVFIVSKGTAARKVLTGSTNFSVTGLYVNSNHVLILDDPDVASLYAQMFEDVWAGKAWRSKFLASERSQWIYPFLRSSIPATEVSFAPHEQAFAEAQLGEVAERIRDEGEKDSVEGSVLFAVMSVDQGNSPVYDALKELHENDGIFSYGISDDPGGISLYKPGERTGVLVTGKPLKTQLPRPFTQIRYVSGVGHQIHHKFVVCGFNGHDPVVYCGSSNLALGGEQENGDNLLAIRDPDVATVFAVEALGLIDHFHFLSRVAEDAHADNVSAAVAAEWFLSTTGRWAEPYFDPTDLHYVDRQVFA